MRFVLVHGMTPFSQARCACCNQPISAGYLRDTGTRLYYCDPDCYALSAIEQPRDLPLHAPQASELTDAALSSPPLFGASVSFPRFQPPPNAVD